MNLSLRQQRRAYAAQIEEGRAAYEAGDRERPHPPESYSPFSYEHSWWLHGWWGSYYAAQDALEASDADHS